MQVLRLKKAIRVLAMLVAGWSALPYCRIAAPAGFALLFPKLLAGALTPVLGAISALGALAGLVGRDPLAFLSGELGALLSTAYVRRVTAAHNGFVEAFGPDWQQAIPVHVQQSMLQRRWTWRLPQRPAARLTSDVPFWTIPGADRTLRCDIWQPPPGVPPSGVAYLYFHGSGWYILDKDVGTRRLFRHLAAQGHVVMDVAYRLYPEVELMGMLGDVKRAVAWMKANAGRFDVDPARIVVGQPAGNSRSWLPTPRSIPT